METSKRQFMGTLAGLAGLAAGGVFAQQAGGAFPTRAIRIVVPFTPGSGSDNTSRFFGDQMTAQLGQGVFVDNRPGAQGTIALTYVKGQPADGYTVLLASNSPIAVNPLVMKDLGYDPVKDFKPVFGLSRGMNVVVVPNESRFKTIDDLLAAARNASLNVGTYSEGYRLVMEWLSSVTGAKFVNVPYKGQAQIMTDIIGNQLDCALVDLGGAAQLIQAGRLRPLAVTGESRNRMFPEVPTIREKGHPDFVTYSWTSFYVRTGTPDAVVDRLAAVIAKAHTTEGAQALVDKSGGELMPYPPAQMQRFHLAEIERFRKIAQTAGIKPQ